MRTLTRIALLAGCAFALGCGPPPTHLVLITIDTLRADHLGVYGYARDTSPALDALAREGIAFTRCYAQSVVTRASHASLFTRAIRARTACSRTSSSTSTARRSSPRCAPRGYATAGFVSSAC
jgi:arylsulfatase A-like enzyme